MKIAAIAIGGMVGAFLRFWIGFLLTTPETAFPYPTLFINILGSFVLGWFVMYGAKMTKNETWILGLQSGLLGSFTTFSTFNAEIILLWDRGLISTAILYFTISAVAGAVALLVGMKYGSLLSEKAGAEQ